ncbi:3-hydroxyacyl-ACP dehydratase [Photobacterium jeanii]|uniref:3-hydroxyacyl-ACP dehydratase n=1 Tax=Photobacterium jeanii TaxID=858640 RepID=A0A178K2S0_9GAMM|nr:3-hydroxyacyl-ACP dehydratase [Photobacterium jeanii]OAN11012.1 3-hydroxyacyl-ACP dehydratase [Photobacterium jeanii]PST90527.1 3-hydroxyacyl-ACP dehydratase [Photobacterium jeanii]
MTKRKPTIVDQVVSDNKATLTLKVDADIADFQGHFAQFALLPGVTQIDWATHYGQALLNAAPQFAGMEVIKFQEPITPDMTVTLNLEWVADKKKLYFSYQSEAGTHSSGRIKLSN